MTVYMQHALDLITAPAALYEWPSLRFVSENTAGLGRARSEWTDLAVDELRESVGAAPDRHWVRHTDLGEVHFSICEPLPSHSRPPLLLASLHADRDRDGTADHFRMRTALLANEGLEVAENQLNTALQMVASTVASMREITRIVNESISYFDENARPSEVAARNH